MSIEDDREHLAEQMKKAMGSVMASQPDALVFCLRGKEIQELLVEMAVVAEADAERLAKPKNVTPIRRPRAQRFGLGVPPGYPEPPSAEEMAVFEEARTQEIVVSLRANATKFRFLAGHIEEDRYFRLGIHDLTFLGLTPQLVGCTGPM